MQDKYIVNRHFDIVKNPNGWQLFCFRFSNLESIKRPATSSNPISRFQFGMEDYLVSQKSGMSRKSAKSGLSLKSGKSEVSQKSSVSATSNISGKQQKRNAVELDSSLKSGT